MSRPTDASRPRPGGSAAPDAFLIRCQTVPELIQVLLHLRDRVKPREMPMMTLSFALPQQEAKKMAAYFGPERKAR